MEITLELQQVTPAFLNNEEEGTSKPVYLVQFGPVQMTEEELHEFLKKNKEHTITAKVA